jgi:DNA-binding MarR family transcriptional regulator
LIKPLEKKNLIVRVPSQADKRFRLIYLTHKATSYREDLLDIAEHVIDEAERGISQQELAIFKKVMEQIIKNVQ